MVGLTRTDAGKLIVERSGRKGKGFLYAELWLLAGRCDWPLLQVMTIAHSSRVMSDSGWFSLLSVPKNMINYIAF